MTGKTKREREARHKRFYAVPDSVLAAARDAGELGTTVADDGTNSEAKDGTVTNFAKIGAARDKVLQARLDQASQSSGISSNVGTSTSVDPKGYITSLNKLDPSAQVNVGDVDFARKLLKSAVESKHRQRTRLDRRSTSRGVGREARSRQDRHCPRMQALSQE